MKKAGVFETAQKYKFKKVTYTGNHDATALAIQNKTLDVGAIDSAIYANLVKQNKVDGSKIKKIWQSGGCFSTLGRSRKMSANRTSRSFKRRCTALRIRIS